jgi:6-pyruvoyltetrahydropterin/6-carboxytetrahydropterin synthase
MAYFSTKTWEHAFSCCFRQWRAKSHCRLLHGYAFTVRVEFAARELDANNWVVDFGQLKDFKRQLEDVFDHKLVIAADDPMASALLDLQHVYGMAAVVTLPSVGCESFAAYIYTMAEQWLIDNKQDNRVNVHVVEVSEHGANSAIYSG